MPDTDAEPPMESASQMAMNDTTPPRTANRASSDAGCTDLLAVHGQDIPEGPLTYRAPSSILSTPPSVARTPSIDDPNWFDECLHSGVEDEGVLDPFQHGSIQNGGLRNGIADAPDASSNANLQRWDTLPIVTALEPFAEVEYHEYPQDMRMPTVSANGSHRETVPSQQHRPQVCTSILFLTENTTFCPKCHSSVVCHKHCRLVCSVADLPGARVTVNAG